MSQISLPEIAPITVVVVDDEPLSRARLIALLRREPDFEVVAECADGVQALNAITAQAPELVFLDVQMPELDGLGVLDALVGSPIPVDPEIIFATAFDAYMERAFEVHAVDYLRKPYTDARFLAALEKGRRRVLARRRELSDGREAASSPLAALRPFIASTRAWRQEQSESRLVVWDRRRSTWTFVPVSVIDSIRADGAGHVSVQAQGETYTWSITLREVEQRLDPGAFLRVHRSWIVNRERVRQVKGLTKGEYALIMADGSVIDSGRTYRQAIEAFVSGA